MRKEKKKMENKTFGSSCKRQNISQKDDVNKDNGRIVKNQTMIRILNPLHILNNFIDVQYSKALDVLFNLKAF